MAKPVRAAAILGVFICVGLVLGSWILGSSALQFKAFERSVSVKGLAEREVPADVAVWPIRFSVASAQLDNLHENLEQQTREVLHFLQREGFNPDEITAAAPLVNDKLAQQWSGQEVQLRYTALQVITVYTREVERVRSAQGQMAELGRKGIVFGGDEYSERVTYLFTGLNELKPVMIEESTRAARQAAEKFAADSNSKIGKLKAARQGQFTIEDRDSNTPHLKKVRVVSSLDYYLSD